jgi:hypothetical protein
MDAEWEKNPVPCRQHPTCTSPEIPRYLARHLLFNICFSSEVYTLKVEFLDFSFYVRYSTLYHLLPLRSYSVGGCWDLFAPLKLNNTVIQKQGTFYCSNRKMEEPGKFTEMLSSYMNLHKSRENFLFFLTVYAKISRKSCSSSRKNCTEECMARRMKGVCVCGWGDHLLQTPEPNVWVGWTTSLLWPR